eukprot:7429254-Alexandrium_andersonii.AAC.1
MSASLVGSEMCIRDRRRGQWLASLAHAFHACGPQFIPSVPIVSGTHGFPVSYTHLTLPTICSV